MATARSFGDVEAALADSRMAAIRPLIVLIWLLPALWLIGGERLLFPLLAVGLLLPKVKKEGTSRLSMNAPAWWLLGFIAASFVSAIQINNEMRIVTFLWDFTIYLGYFTTILFVTKTVDGFDQIKRIVFHLVIFSVFAQLIASTYFTIGSWRYESLIGQLLPSGFRDTMIGKGILARAVGKELWLLGINERVKSIFSSSIHFGTFLMMTMPLAMFLVTTSKGRARWLAFLVLASSAVFLLYSQSRTAMVLSIVMLLACYATVQASRSRAFGPPMLAAIGLIASLVVGAIAAIFWSDISESIAELFIESRAASFDNRAAIYTQTIDWIFRQPILGYGTQTDVPGLGYPLGSHNWYLAVLFKHGLVAFVPFLFFLASVVSCAVGNIFRNYQSREVLVLAISLSCWFFCYMLLCLTIEPVVDAIHLFVAGCLVGIILTLPKLAKKTDLSGRGRGYGKVGVVVSHPPNL